MFLSCAACLVVVVALPAFDVTHALERLSAPTLEERAAAQRELSRTLEADDYDVVRTRAAAGDAEVRRRLVFALADLDRHLGLATRLACEGDGKLAALGREVIGEMIARWSPGHGRIGLGGSETIAKLGEKKRFDRPLTFATGAPIDLEETLDALVLAAPGAAPLVLDPDARTSEAPDAGSAAVETIEATFDRALAELLRARRLGLEGFGLENDLEDRAQPWLRITRRGTEARQSGTALLTEWCVGSLCAQDPDRRSACARALAASAWPAAIAWLEARWLRGPDDAALDGLLLAAGRGHVARSFARVDRWRGLDERMRADAAERTSAADRRAQAIARALGAVGASSLGGEDLVAPALEGWPDLSPRELWLRLVVLEGSARSSPAARERIGALLGDPARALPGRPASLAALDPGSLGLAMLRLQGLRALTGSGSASLELAGSGSAPLELGFGAQETRAWLGHLARAQRLDEAIGLLIAQSIRPPAQLLPPRDRTELSEPERRAALEWIVFVADPSEAARTLVDHLSGALDRDREIEALAGRFLPRVRSGESNRLIAVLRGTRELGSLPAEALDRLLVLSGAGDSGQTLDAVLALGRGVARHDLLVVGALAAGPRGATAREALLRALAGPAVLEDLIAALERAIAELRAARLETEERSFIAAVRAAVRASDPVRRARLRVDVWPAAQSPEPIDLGAFDRSLSGTGL